MRRGWWMLAGVLVAPVPLPLGAQDPASRAWDALLGGEYQEAIGLYQRAAREAPSREVMRGLAEALRAVGRVAEAERDVATFVSAAAPGTGLSNLLGELRRERGDRAGAEAAFRQALTNREADSLRARLNLAVLRLERGEREAAFAEFDRFIDVYNRAARLTSDELAVVAEAVWRLGARDPQLYRDALRALDRAIAADSTNQLAQTRVGDLFLEKYNGTEARAAYDAVLQRNPRHPLALVGRARTARFEGAGDAQGYVDRALEVNPSLLPARLLHAELLLEREAYADAQKETERALQTDSASLEGWALLGAVQYLAHDTVAFRAAERRALALNPRYDGFYTRLAELAARNRLYARAADWAVRALRLDSTSWHAHAVLGMNQLRLGRMAAGRRSLERAFGGDPYDVWTKNTLDLLDVLDQYRDLPAEPATLVAEPREAELLALYAGPLAREAYDSLARRYRHRPPVPIRVELYARHADFSVRTVGLAGLGALGASFGPVVAMDSPSARAEGEFHWGSTLWHELAHTFHLDLSDHRVPRWLSEGLAVYEERRARPGWGMPLDLGFLLALREGNLHPVSELNRGFTSPRSPEALGHAYYQAALVCEFLAGEHGDGVFRRMLTAYGGGATTDQVFRTVLGVEPAALNHGFDDWMRQRFAAALAALPRPGAAPGHDDPEVVIARARVARSDFVTQLEAGRALLARGDLAGARAPLERAAELIPDYAATDSPLWYLGQVFRRSGDLRRAEQVLARLVALNAGHYPGLMELAVVRDSLHDAVGAAAALDAALYVYPLAPAAHARLASAAEGLGRNDLAIRERRALVALGPVDRAGAEFELARAYFRAGDLANARRAVLRALERAPNFVKAQELLLAIRAAQASRP
jgi:tetratricopeptide (TPR) repeat protein